MFRRFWWVFLVMLPVGAMAGLLVAAVVTYVMPKQYESDAVIEVRPRTVGVSALGVEPSGGTTMTPQFFGTEFEKIKSRNSLEKVVERLELSNRWMVDKEAAMRILKGIVNTQNIRGTDLISIRVRHTNKVDARDICAEVATAYKEYRTEIEGRDAERVLYEMNKAVKDQEDKVEERRKVLAGKSGLRRPLYHSGEPVIGAEDVTLPDAQDYIDAKREFETDLELLNTMKIGQMGKTISRKIPSDSVVIHDEPVIADSPVSPNVTLNLALGTALGLLLSPLMALPVMWMQNRSKSAKA